MRLNLEAFDTCIPPRLTLRGPTCKVHLQAEDALLDYLEENPTAYLDELVAFLLETKISVSKSLISRLLQSERISKKRITRVHIGQNQELRDTQVRTPL